MIRQLVRRLLPLGTASFVLMVSGFSVAAMPELLDGTIEGARKLGEQALAGPLHHVQGLALTPGRIFVTSVDLAGHRAFLDEFDRASGRPLRRVELTDGVRYHAGGISLGGGSLWVPVAENRAHSSAVLVELDAATLAVRRRIAIADHIGCVAAAGTTLIAGNWDSETLYRIDLATGAITARPNPSRTHFQDMKLAGGALVASGNLDWWSGTVDWIDPATLRVRRSLRAGAIGPLKPVGRGGPLTGEGMAIEGDDLYLIPEDGPSRVLHYRLTPRPAPIRLASARNT